MKSALNYLSLLTLLFGLPASATNDCNCTPCKTINNENWSLVPDVDEQWKCPDACLYRETSGEERCFCDPGDTDYTLTCDAASSSDCQCGLAARRVKIVGGEDTEVNEYPWQVALVYLGFSMVQPYCGGSLISDQWILSAAHCTKSRGDVEYWKAVLGEHDYMISTETDHIRADIELIVDHPEYDDETVNFDFTLIKMTEKIDFSTYPHIRPICLPANGENTYNSYAAIVTGWGTTSSDGESSRTLQEVDVNVLSNDECKNDYWYEPDQITEQMLCANIDGGGQDSCQGDSGGPLITSGSGQNYELIGVVSWGAGCALASYPGVYARVTQQLDWIGDTTAD